MSPVVAKWVPTLVACVLGTVFTGVTLAHVRAHEGVYSTQVDVVFLAPTSARYPNNIQETSASLIATAGLMESLMRSPGTSAMASSSSASLTGTGVTDGYWVRLVQSGNQWQANYDKPVIEVEVAGPSPSEVASRATHLVDRIREHLAHFQDADGVARNERITTLVSPSQPSVRYSNGRPARAMAATLVLGALLTLLAGSAWTRWGQRIPHLRRRLRSEVSSTGLVPGDPVS